MFTAPPTPGPADRTQSARAYRAGGRMTRDRLAREAPCDAAALTAVEASDLIVVSGQYDHVEQVLGALEMPYTPVAPGNLSRISLRRDQLLVVNCPGQLRAGDVAFVRDFVAGGGSLFTTDWALKHVIEPAFPGTVAYNGTQTTDDVVPIEVLDRENPFLHGVMDGQDEPRWWLETASYPIRVIDHDAVRVLINSRELGNRFGEAPVAVLFRWGEGEVFHMINHYYLQRSELRSARQRASAAGYFAEKGLRVPSEMACDVARLAVGDVESAATSSRLFANVVAAKKRASMKARRAERRHHDGNGATR